MMVQTFVVDVKKIEFQVVFSVSIYFLPVGHVSFFENLALGC